MPDLRSHFMDSKDNFIKKNSIIKGRFLNILLHFFRRSTFHGFTQIANAKNIRQRFFWIVICFLASLGFFINIHYLFIKYTEVPILSNVYQNYESYTFPDVSFCFTNPIYFPPINSSDYFKFQRVYRNYKHFRQTTSPFIRKRVNLAEYLFMKIDDFYSHKPELSIVSCNYMGYECDYTHFDIRHIYSYGLCYTFNSTKILNKSIKNISSISNEKMLKPMFQIIIYKAVDMIPDLLEDPFSDISMPSGVILMIHEENTFPSVASSYIVDKYSQINLKITHMHHFNLNNSCRLERQKNLYFDLFTNETLSFIETLDDCVFVTVQGLVSDNCNCLWPRYPSINTNRTPQFCLNNVMPHYQLMRCLKKTFNQVEAKKDLYSCYKDLCDHKYYETVISQSKFPAIQEKGTHLQWLKTISQLEKYEENRFNMSDLRFKALRPNPKNLSVSQVYKSKLLDLIDEDFVDKNFAMISIIPSSLFMDKVEEMMEYPLSRLISDIGGSVGLWVGASLITIFEFLDLLFDILETRFPMLRESTNNEEDDEDENFIDENQEKHEDNVKFVNRKPQKNTSNLVTKTEQIEFFNYEL